MARLHVLDCLRKLHPTPALAGMPKDASLQFLRSREAPRGWFGGPVGWMDRDGNGEFAVGIRAALHEGSSARMFAGAGIVEGSIPEQEWEETDQKLNVMRYVLGLSEEAPWLRR